LIKLLSQNLWDLQYYVSETNGIYFSSWMSETSIFASLLFLQQSTSHFFTSLYISTFTFCLLFLVYQLHISVLPCWSTHSKPLLPFLKVLILQIWDPKMISDCRSLHWYCICDSKFGWPKMMLKLRSFITIAQVALTQI